LQEETSSQPVKKVFVGGLNRQTTKESIREFFEQFGVVTDVDCPLDQKSGLGRGFAYVTFDDNDVVDKISCKSFSLHACLDFTVCASSDSLPHAGWSSLRGEESSDEARNEPTA
jgi:hypothetical protein